MVASVEVLMHQACLCTCSMAAWVSMERSLEGALLEGKRHLY